MASSGRRDLAKFNARMWALATIDQIAAYEVAATEARERMRATPPQFDADASARRYVAAHLVLIAANNLRKALDQTELPDGLPTSLGGVEEPLMSLRDVWEHWEQHQPSFAVALGRNTSRAGTGFHLRYPHHHPWGLLWNPGEGDSIGGVLSLDGLRRVAQQVLDATDERGPRPKPGPSRM